uniref:non-specific serine/threonine protein kinase n=1 Tax=Tetradesmus obliquus TaxID=3088 RepID=A0A383WPH6_TETOB|eukprot:jgi/Sobl393_1/8935/SZX79345.1
MVEFLQAQLSPTYVQTMQDDHKGALQEAQLLSSMDHPNIIKYYDSFLDSEGALCIATTYCEDGDLFSRICVRKAEGRYFTEDEVMDTFIQVASALLYIHSRKIMHRDLKTQNIFLKSDGIVMLGDFGICKVLEKTADFATTVTGTPYYMAPGVCTNQPYTFKSDLWSLGCVLYELCTLTHAFAADSLLSLVYQIVGGSYPPIPADMFSADMQQLVQQLLTNDAVQRPSLQQVLALPYVQGHMARFNAEERRRIFCKQTSLNGMRGLQPRADAGEGVPAGAFEGSPSCESTMPSGLTPKQRIALKKEEERRRRQLELQVASVNVNRERQEVAKRKQSQLASSSLLGILPAASAHSSASTSPDRPASPSHHMMQQQQQQQWQQQGVVLAGTSSRPASAQACAEACKGCAVSTQHGGSGSGGSGKVPSPAAAPAVARPGSLAAAANATNGAAAAALGATKTAYQAYEERAVGAGSKNNAPGFFIYDEHDDAVNLATMPAQQQQLLHAVRPASGRPAARTGRDLCELSMDSDSVLLGSVQQQRPFTAPIAAAANSMAADWLQQPYSFTGAGGCAKAASEAGAAKACRNVPSFLAASSKGPAAALVEAASRPQRSTSEPAAALAAAAAAAGGVAGGFKFGLDTVERKAFSCGGGSAAAGACGAAASHAHGNGCSSVPTSSDGCRAAAAAGPRHSPLGALCGAEVVRFGVQSEAEPASVFEVVLCGGCHVTQQQQVEQLAGRAQVQQQECGKQVQHQCVSPSNGSSRVNARYASHSPGRDAAARTVSDDAAGDDTAASVAAGNRKTVSHHDDEYADEGFEDYEADFEEAADGCGDQDAAGVADELRQRQRIMQLVAEMSMSMSSLSMCSEDSAATPSTAAAQQQPATKAASSSSPRVQQQQQSRIQAPAAPADLAHSASSSSTCSGVGAKQQAELAVFQVQLGGQFAPVHDYLVRVHKGAAAGGASVRGDEVKACLLGMVGRDQAKLEACFALEQVVFRAVLAGQ